MRIGLSIACCLFALTATAADGVPKIVCGAPIYNYGEVNEQTKLIQHAFKLRNAGTATLEIGEVKTTCGCTVAEMAVKSLEPGETAELKVDFKPAAPGKQ